MKADRSKRTTVTAAELLAELQQNPIYLTRHRKLEDEQRKNVEVYSMAVAPMLQELIGHGIKIQVLSELRAKKSVFRKALPILLKWLPLISQLQAKSEIVGLLATTWARPAAAKPLIEEFRHSLNETNFRWAVGDALSLVADDSVLDSIAELVCDKRYGRSREMLAVALGNMTAARAFPILVGLLEDEEVAGHAIMGLVSLKLPATRPYFQKFLNHPKKWVREEAAKGL